MFTINFIYLFNLCKLFENLTMNSSQPWTGHHRGPASRQPLNREAVALSQAENRWNGMCPERFKNLKPDKVKTKMGFHCFGRQNASMFHSLICQQYFKASVGGSHVQLIVFLPSYRLHDPN